MQPAKRLGNFPPYVFATLASRIKVLQAQGIDVIRLDIGSPDLPPPPAIVDALAEAARRPDNHGYPSFNGTPALRRAMAGYYARRFAVELDPETEVLPLIGSKEGIAHLALAWLDAGDVALVPDPGYPVYGMGALIAGAEPYPVPLMEGNDYLPDLDALPAAVVQRARLLWLNYPNNPTGATAGLAFFERAVAFARRHDLLLCHDAPYCDVGFDGYQAPSLLQVPGAREVAVEFNSLSKSHNMAGWRIGMAVGNAGVLAALLQVKSNVDSGIFQGVQAAAAAALTGDQAWIHERNTIYQARRDLVLAGLHQAGLRAATPQAGLYVWAATPSGVTAAAFADRLLVQTGVSVTPGSAFGAHGEGYFRISLGTATARLAEAMRRLEHSSTDD
jgi:LL-diaminopimelate aminotransferase